MGPAAAAAAASAGAAVEHAGAAVGAAADEAVAQARSAGKEASQLASQAGVQARSSVENLAHALSASAASVQRSPAVRKLRALTGKYERAASSEWKRAQRYLSDVHHVTAALLILEASLLVTRVLFPAFAYTLHFGSSGRLAAVKNQLTGHPVAARLPHVAITLPHPLAFVSAAFWQPIAVWGLWTFAVPYAASRESFAGRALLLCWG